MKPQDNGYTEPHLPSGQQNLVAGWQTQHANPDMEINQQTATPVGATLTHAAPTVPVSPSVATPQMANDSDLIEKEWVNAAKKIMDTFSTDPYNKSRALTLLKADYMRKRYNKDIKVSEN
jgi:hypothetical protein